MFLTIWILLLLSVYLIYCDTKYRSDRETSLDSFAENPFGDQHTDATIIGEPEPFGTEDKGNFFMDLYSIQTGPKQVEFGHVFEDPHVWEQRYEQKDHENKRFQGQVRYGDKHGGYGEHYWDYNHGGNNDDETGGGGNEEMNADYSANVPSSTDGSSYSPSPNIGGYKTSEDALSTIPKEYSTKKNVAVSSSNKKFKNYNEIRSGRPSQSEYSTKTTAAASSTQSTLNDDDNFFIIPKISSSYSTNSYDIDTPEEIRRSLNKIKIPTRTYEDVETDLYEKLKGMPSIRDRYKELSSTASNPKSSNFFSKDRLNYS